MFETFTHLAERASRHPQIIRNNQMSKECCRSLPLAGRKPGIHGN